MRPEEHRQRSRAAAVARGRMFLKADLSWLPGFPVGQGKGTVEWMSVPRGGDRGPERVSLGREEVRRATVVWEKLAHHFPRALPRIVEDSSRWVEGVSRILDRLKRTIHRGEALAPSLMDTESGFPPSAVRRAAALVRSHPGLRPLVDALSWTLLLTPRELPAALTWITPRRRRLSVIMSACPGPDGVVAVLGLWRLAQRDGSRYVDHVLRYLGDARAYSVPVGKVSEYRVAWNHMLKRAERRPLTGRPPPRPEAELGDQLLQFVAWVARRDERTRRRALRLLAPLLPESLLDEWQSFWRRLDDVTRDAKDLVWSPRRASDIASRFEALQEDEPPKPHIDRLMGNVRECSVSVRPEVTRELIPLLELLPERHEGVLLRPAFLAHGLHVARRSPGGAADLHRELRSLISRDPHCVGVYALWEGVLRAWDWSHSWCLSLSDTILDEVSDRALWPVVFRAIGRCCNELPGKLSENEGATIVSLVLASGDDRTSAAHVKAMVDAGLRERYTSSELLRCAHVLDQGQGRFAAILGVMRDLDVDTESLAKAATCLEDAGWCGLAGSLVLDGLLRELQLAGHQTRTLLRLTDEVGNPPSPPGSLDSPSWSRCYPPELIPRLALLNEMDPDAERIAGRLLGKDFPDPEKLRRQLAVVEEKVLREKSDGRLRQRRDTLRVRLRSPRAVSPVRRAKLGDKLDRAVRRAVLRAWRGRLEDALRRGLSRLMDYEDIPDWLMQPRQLDGISAMLALPASRRRLGLRLLRTRCGPPPWNLIDDPTNQAFLERLRACGVDTEPWIHPPEPREWTGDNGAKVVLSFEDDPLEIFQMGAPFKTCLAPGEFNFFSVLANAADINKHVLFARDSQGRVVGRCLIALTEEGALLTFHPYCHDPNLGFGTMVSRAAERLARQMGTDIAPRGTVPSLVASDWYDDGPVDLGGRFAFLAKDSKFRKSLSSIDCGRWKSTLESLFDPLPLNSLTLPLVLELPEVSTRPELIIPLLPSIERSSGLSDELWMDAARLAYRAGAVGFAGRVLQRRGESYLLETCGEDWVDEETIPFAAQIMPSLVLRALRRTRPSGVRKDEDETSDVRRESLALAHEALGRLQRAQRLREGASSSMSLSVPPSRQPQV